MIAKIIAGEYNAPGTYTMSTLQTVKMLGKEDLELFEKISGLLIGKEHLPRILFSGQGNVKKIMRIVNLDFVKLQALQSLGLFLPNDMERTITNTEKKKVEFQYFDKKLIYIPDPNASEIIRLPGFYGLSAVGKQILEHLEPKYVKEYYVWLKENYKIPNYKLSE